MLEISHALVATTSKAQVVDEFKQSKEINISAERPLIISIDGEEIVTLMTLGSHPEALALGYLRNQRLILSMDELLSIKVNWQQETAHIVSKNGIKNLNKKIANRTVTTGCGQGTVFSCTMDEVYNTRLAAVTIQQQTIYALLAKLAHYNTIYRSAGAVHSCALCQKDEILISVEDVGRHNAADAIAGLMWLDNINNADDFIFYTTGRVTSEIVMKVSQMNIAVILSRSGVTSMGLEIAQDIGMLIIARAKGKHFLVYSGVDMLVFD